MMEINESAEFFFQLNSEQQEDLAGAIADDIFFLEGELQNEIIQLLERTDVKLSKMVKNKLLVD